MQMVELFSAVIVFRQFSLAESVFKWYEKFCVKTFFFFLYSYDLLRLARS